MRFSGLPPYSSVRRLSSGVRNEANRFMCAPWIMAMSKPALLTRRTQSTQCCLTSSISARSISLVVARVVDAGDDRGREGRTGEQGRVADGAGVGELDGQLGTVAVHLVGEDRQAGDVAVADDREATVEIAGSVEVDGRGADGDQPDAGAGLGAEELHQVVGGGAGEGLRVTRHDRRELDAVLEGHAADGDRPEHVRISRGQ